MSFPHELPTTVQEALQANNTILAIKRLRESTGLGLKDAKEVVDAYRSGDPMPRPIASEDGLYRNTKVGPLTPLTPPMIAALQSGRQLVAIKLIRGVYNVGLKEAKDAVDTWLANHPDVVVVKQSNSPMVGWLLALGTTAGAIYYFLHQ